MNFHLFTKGVWSNLPVDTNNLDRTLDEMGFPRDAFCPLNRPDAYFTGNLCVNSDPNSAFRYLISLNIGEHREEIVVKTLPDLLMVLQSLTSIFRLSAETVVQEDFQLHIEGHGSHSFPFCPHCAADQKTRAHERIAAR